MVFINVSLFCSQDKIFFKSDDFFFHGITKANFKGRADLFLNFFFKSSFNSWKVEYFSLRCTLISIKFSFFGEDCFSDFLILEFNIIEGVETDDFRIQSFVSYVELCKQLLRVDGLLGCEFFKDCVLVHFYVFLLTN